MNAEQRFNKIEQRLDTLEQDRDGIVESEKILLKLARLHRISLQELKAQLELDMGDVRERFDIIERKVETIERKVETIERKVETIERKVETIERTMVTKDDFTKVETRMGSMDSKIDQILQLLEPK